MKKKDVLAIASLFCLCGCGNSEKEIIPIRQQLFPLQFSVRMEPENLPFPTTRSIPPLTIPEPSPNTPGGETPTPPEGNTDELYMYLDYLVFQANEPDRIVKHKHYTSDDVDFGIVYDSLPAGDYHLCFLAHSNKEISFSNRTATFSKVADTFWAFQNQAVGSGAEIVQDLDLYRIISQVEFVSTEMIPQNLKRFEMNISGFQHKIDLSTGIGLSENTPYAYTYTFQPDDVGKTRFTHSFQTFIPTDGKTLNAQLTAYDPDGNVMLKRDVIDIKPIRNRVIRYTGKLYTPPGSDDTFTIHISNDGKWEDPIENELND